MRHFKLISAIAVVIIIIANGVFYVNSYRFVQQFCESVYISLEHDKNGAKLVTFNAQNAQQIANLDALELKKLQKNGELLISDKLDANLFYLRYYKSLENGEFNGFSGEFVLSESRLYASYFMMVLSVILLGIFAYSYKLFNQHSLKLGAKVDMLKKQLAKEQQMSLIDPLTNMPNQLSLNKAINAAAHPKLFLIEVMDFRKITDFFDSTSVDDLLRQLAFVIQDFTAEWKLQSFCVEGDVFAFLSDSEEDIEYYEELVFSFLELIRSKEFSICYESSSFDVVLSITVGMSLESENCLRKAQIALKRAKAEYKNCMCYAKYLDDEKSYLEVLHTAKNIQDAVSNNEILPFFQPIYNRAGEICKYESLVRIVKKTPEGTMVLTPQSFLAISVKMKQYEQIEKFVINKVIQALKDNPTICLTINLSGRDMNDSVANSRFLNLVRSAGVAQRLTIEVLEDEDISQNERIKDFLRRAKDLGCLIALDDFGSGFSNFAYLLELMPHYIKIDGSIIRHIAEDEKSLNILKTIVLFSKSLGIKTVAEFVCNKEIYDICYEVGVDEFQGFYLGKPSPSFSPEEIDLDFYKLSND